MMTLRKLWAFVVRDFVQTASYRFNFVVSLAGILLSSVSFFFLSRLIPGEQVPALAQYGGEYFPFALVGIAFYSFLGVGLQTLADSISRAQATGTLEALLVTPTPVTIVIFASTLFTFFFAAARVVVYLLFGTLLFGVDLSHANFPAALVVLGLSFATFIAIGMVSAAFVMVFKKGNPPGWVFGGVSTIFGGVIFPVESLPHWLQPASKALPITYALEAMRLAVLRGEGLGDLWRPIAALLGFAIVLLPAGVISFSLAIRRTKRTGTLVQY
jgi:ABC-2 type transport system permease protein